MISLLLYVYVTDVVSSKSDSNIDSTHIYISYKRSITILCTAYRKLQDILMQSAFKLRLHTKNCRY